MIHIIAGQAVLQISLIGLILLFPCGLKPHSQTHYTFLENVFMLCQMFNLINARATETEDDPTIGLFDTPLFFGIMIGVGLVQLILVEIAGPFFSCIPLNSREWLICLGLAGLTLPAGFLIRRFPTKNDSWKSQTRREDNQRFLN
jgi:magnesium-transporting ATPase (P-type)